MVVVESVCSAFKNERAPVPEILPMVEPVSSWNSSASATEPTSPRITIPLVREAAISINTDAFV